MRRLPINGKVPNSIRELNANAYDWFEDHRGRYMIDHKFFKAPKMYPSNVLHTSNTVWDRVVRFFKRIWK